MQRSENKASPSRVLEICGWWCDALFVYLYIKYLSCTPPNSFIISIPINSCALSHHFVLHIILHEVGIYSTEMVVYLLNLVEVNSTDRHFVYVEKSKIKKISKWDLLLCWILIENEIMLILKSFVVMTPVGFLVGISGEWLAFECSRFMGEAELWFYGFWNRLEWFEWFGIDLHKNNWEVESI